MVLQKVDRSLEYVRDIEEHMRSHPESAHLFHRGRLAAEKLALTLAQSKMNPCESPLSPGRRSRHLLEGKKGLVFDEESLSGLPSERFRHSSSVSATPAACRSMASSRISSRRGSEPSTHLRTSEVSCDSEILSFSIPIPGPSSTGIGSSDSTPKGPSSNTVRTPFLNQSHPTALFPKSQSIPGVEDARLTYLCNSLLSTRHRGSPSLHTVSHSSEEVDRISREYLEELAALQHEYQVKIAHALYPPPPSSELETKVGYPAPALRSGHGGVPLQRQQQPQRGPDVDLVGSPGHSAVSFEASASAVPRLQVNSTGLPLGEKGVSRSAPQSPGRLGASHLRKRGSSPDPTVVRSAGCSPRMVGDEFLKPLPSPPATSAKKRVPHYALPTRTSTRRSSLAVEDLLHGGGGDGSEDGLSAHSEPVVVVRGVSTAQEGRRKSLDVNRPAFGGRRESSPSVSSSSRSPGSRTQHRPGGGQGGSRQSSRRGSAVGDSSEATPPHLPTPHYALPTSTSARRASCASAEALSPLPQDDEVSFSTELSSVQLSSEKERSTGSPKEKKIEKGKKAWQSTPQSRSGSRAVSPRLPQSKDDLMTVSSSSSSPSLRRDRKSAETIRNTSKAKGQTWDHSQPHSRRQSRPQSQRQSPRPRQSQSAPATSQDVLDTELEEAVLASTSSPRAPGARRGKRGKKSREVTSSRSGQQNLVEDGHAVGEGGLLVSVTVEKVLRESEEELQASLAASLSPQRSSGRRGRRVGSGGPRHSSPRKGDVPLGRGAPIPQERSSLIRDASFQEHERTMRQRESKSRYTVPHGGSFFQEGPNYLGRSLHVIAEPGSLDGFSAPVTAKASDPRAGMPTLGPDRLGHAVAYFQQHPRSTAVPSHYTQPQASKSCLSSSSAAFTTTAASSFSSSKGPSAPSPWHIQGSLTSDAGSISDRGTTNKTNIEIMLQELENSTKLDRSLARSLGVPVTEEPTTRSGPRREVTMHRKRAIEEEYSLLSVSLRGISKRRKPQPKDKENPPGIRPSLSNAPASLGLNNPTRSQFLRNSSHGDLIGWTHASRVPFQSQTFSRLVTEEGHRTSGKQSSVVRVDSNVFFERYLP